MRILVVYPMERDDGSEDYDGYFSDLHQNVNESIGDEIDFLETDAGAGASVPAIFLMTAGTAATLLTIFSAPKLIRENLPEWKGLYDRITSFLKKENLSYHIDIDTAINCAIFYILNKHGYTYSDVEIISCTIHTPNIGGGSSAYIQAIEAPHELPENLVDREFEAAHQMNRKYIFAVSVDGTLYSIIVENDGSCSYLS